MKKQVSLIILITIVLVMLFGLTMQVFATDTSSKIQPRTGEPINSETQPSSEYDVMPISENEQIYGETLPQNEMETISLNEDLKNIASTETKDNRGAIVAGIVIITVVIIIGLVVWYYKTNY